MLPFNTYYDTQLALKTFLKNRRKARKLSVEALAALSGVPNSTLRKFEATGNISLRQFLLLYSVLADINDIHELTKAGYPPQTLEEVLSNA